MSIGGWEDSADAWIRLQGEHGDQSRREIIDPCLDKVFANVAALEILDVGCGEGRYCRKLADRGAIITGIDPVQAFIDHAKSLDPESTYLVSNAEALPFPDQSFDVVLSYLTIVDIPDYRSAIGEMCRVLRPRGRVVIATISNMASTSDGWYKDAKGVKLHRAIDRYMEEFELDLAWGGMRIINYHRPLSAILAPFFAAGLVMDGFEEPLPPEDSDYFADERRCPSFQVMTLRKP